jgi:hypothetical protein
MDTLVKFISWKKQRLEESDKDSEPSKQPVLENYGNPFET